MPEPTAEKTEITLNMTCTRCNKPVNQCVCPGADRAGEMRKIAYDPGGHVAFKWCRKCDNHYGFCKCDVPEFYIIKGGVDITAGGFTNALGVKIVPDLTQR